MVALNTNLLKALGVDDPQKVLGLRPGEILSCTYADDEPGGCGTTKYCSTCGAAVAMVTSLDSNSCSERLCALNTVRNGISSETAMMVRSQPIEVSGERFLLLFLQDVTRQEFQASLERTFFHDIRNTLQIMVGMSDLIMEDNPSEEMATIQRTTERLLHEVALQRRLMNSGSTPNTPYESHTETLDAAEVLAELREEMAKHPTAAGKFLILSPAPNSSVFNTDRAMLMRILGNMVINACEATPMGGTVKLGVECNGQVIDFTVWNGDTIPPDVQRRIFQRHFSTKNQPGRGIGTYSMKLFGERYLGGKVTFTSTEEDGTMFRLSLGT
ncbi:MAG: HAMP domain-containing histidine kinase [Chitinispirillaceae bacterium]|nr:HAMP domain-containing histidine kinase [Chitinispirillaceae bacterium]